MKRLILSPHVDDEVLGASSVLNDETVVHYAAVDRFHVVSLDDRLLEVARVANLFRFAWEWNEGGVVNALTSRHLVPIYEEIVNRLRPEEVFIAWNGGYNRDHVESHRAALVALRPHDRNWFVPNVYAFEEPDCLWAGVPFPASAYRRLDLEMKNAALELHASQMRGHRSLDLIEAMARVRGEQAGMRHAEGFVVLRSVLQ